MTWYGWAIVIYLSLTAILDVLMVGKKFTVTPAGAALTVVIYMLMIVGIFALAAHS